ncbi:uncharacterized protein VTP21DRAFT_7940 [Calcarisporiella thermophila]|uniref:uncharacterized protein n=1 Tax=Calcarisporiella thermophila TaxID=911321 RepID=UPI0037439865
MVRASSSQNHSELDVVPSTQNGDTEFDFSPNQPVDSASASRFASLISSYDGNFSSLNQAIGLTTEVAIDLEESNEANAVRRLEDCIRTYIDVDFQLKLQQDILKKIKTHLSRGDQLSHLHELYEREYQKELQAYTNTNEKQKFSQNAHIKDFKQKVWDVKHRGEPMPIEEDEDDDLLFTSQHQSLMCPITQSLLKDPVTSTKCRHSYSKDAILGLMRQYNRAMSIQCPISGCEQMLSPNDLRPDKSLARRIARHLAQEAGDELEDAYEVE